MKVNSIAWGKEVETCCPNAIFFSVLLEVRSFKMEEDTILDNYVLKISYSIIAISQIDNLEIARDTSWQGVIRFLPDSPHYSTRIWLTLPRKISPLQENVMYATDGDPQFMIYFLPEKYLYKSLLPKIVPIAQIFYPGPDLSANHWVNRRPDKFK